MSWADGLPLAGADPTTAAKVYALAQPIIDEMGVSLERILGRERVARVAAARHMLFVAMWKAGFSISEIGRVLGKDHTTVIAGIRRAMGASEYKASQLDRALSKARAS